MILGKKERIVEKLVVDFFQKVSQTLPELDRLFACYMKGDHGFKDCAYRVHVNEHEADALRLEILKKIYEGAFLPFYREDYIILTFMGDDIANRAEEVASFLVLTRPEIPGFLREDLRKITSATIDIFDYLQKMIEEGLKKGAMTSNPTREIENVEQRIDRLQWELIKMLFKSELPLAEKLHLKNLIDGTASISDQIEAIAERFEGMMIKRPA